MPEKEKQAHSDRYRGILNHPSFQNKIRDPIVAVRRAACSLVVVFCQSDAAGQDLMRDCKDAIGGELIKVITEEDDLRYCNESWEAFLALCKGGSF